MFFLKVIMLFYFKIVGLLYLILLNWLKWKPILHKIYEIYGAVKKAYYQIY